MASSSPSAEVGATVQVTQRGTRRATITEVYSLPASGVPTLTTRYVLTDSTGATFLARRGEFTVITAAPTKYEILVAAIKAQEEEFLAASHAAEYDVTPGMTIEDSYRNDGRASAYDMAAQNMRDLLKLVGEL